MGSRPRHLPKIRRRPLADRSPDTIAGSAEVHLRFATWAIRVNARELDVQYLLGHSSPMMVRRYSATYDSEQAAKAHAAFSPAMQL